MEASHPNYFCNVHLIPERENRKLARTTIEDWRFPKLPPRGGISEEEFPKHNIWRNFSRQLQTKGWRKFSSKPPCHDLFVQTSKMKSQRKPGPGGKRRRVVAISMHLQVIHPVTNLLESSNLQKLQFNFTTTTFISTMFTFPFFSWLQKSWAEVSPCQPGSVTSFSEVLARYLS